MSKTKKLTIKEIKNRHAKNPKDKELHKSIETGTVDQQEFDNLIEKGTKHKAE